MPRKFMLKLEIKITTKSKKKLSIICNPKKDANKTNRSRNNYKFILKKQLKKR